MCTFSKALPTGDSGKQFQALASFSAKSAHFMAVAQRDVDSEDSPAAGGIFRLQCQVR